MSEPRSAFETRPNTLSFEAINGWRGPGALAIALGHLIVFSDLPGAPHIGSLTVVVDLFFVLSGMIIAQVYGTKLARGSAVVPYVMRRFGRIWPLHAALLGVLVAYELVKFVLQNAGAMQFASAAFSGDGGALVSAIPTNLLLIQSLGLHDRETWNFPSWSLCVEFVTYIVFALYCLTGAARRRWLSIATIVVSLAVLAVAPHGMRSTYDFGVFRCFAGFFAGALTFELAATRALPRWPLPTLVEVAAVLGTGIWAVSAEGTRALLAAPLIFCGFVLVFLQGRGAISRVLRTRPMQIWAEWSYAIYIVHAVVLMFFLAGLRLVGRLLHTELLVPRLFTSADASFTSIIVQTLHIENTGLKALTVAGYIAAVMGFAYLGHRLIEAPGRELFNRWAGAVSRWRKLKPVATRAGLTGALTPAGSRADAAG